MAVVFVRIRYANLHKMVDPSVSYYSFSRQYIKCTLVFSEGGRWVETQETNFPPLIHARALANKPNFLTIGTKITTSNFSYCGGYNCSLFQSIFNLLALQQVKYTYMLFLVQILILKKLRCFSNPSSS